MALAKYFYLNFIKKEKIAKDTYSFYFDSSKDNFDFISGQYVKMNLIIENPDDRGTSRFFTISSSPLEKDRLMITTKVIWTNKSGDFANVSSDPHPTHVNYPPLNLSGFADSQTVELVFNKPGTFKYHNHLEPSKTGTIIVE